MPNGTNGEWYCPLCLYLADELDIAVSHIANLGGCNYDDQCANHVVYRDQVDDDIDQ